MLSLDGHSCLRGAVPSQVELGKSECTAQVAGYPITIAWLVLALDFLDIVLIGVRRKGAHAAHSSHARRETEGAAQCAAG